MKKLITLTIVILLSLTMLTACGNTTLTTEDEALSVKGKVGTATKVEVGTVEESATEYAYFEGYLDENSSAFAYYDITIADEEGKAVQPDGTVEVKVKLTDDLVKAEGDTYAVFYVNGEKFTRLECSEADGYVTFNTDHFSIYVIVKYVAEKSAVNELASGTEAVIPHVHKYKVDETTAVAATCTEAGKNPDEVCSCGEVITGEATESTGHQFGEYTYNNDATTSKDGTETATCATCGEKDTRTKEGTKLKSQASSSGSSSNNWMANYEKYKWYDMGDYFFMIVGDISEVWTYTNQFPAEHYATLQQRYPDRSIIQNGVGNEFTAVFSAVYMGEFEDGRKYPIWSADYVWN